MSPVRHLFEDSAYLKGPYQKDKIFWLYNLIYKYYTAKMIKGPRPKNATPTYAIGVYVTHERPVAENTLAGHVLRSFFLQANADNLLTATVTGKRKREVGLVVPAESTAFTQELKNA